MVTVLNEVSSIASQYLHELRDVTIQKDRRRFEQNVERLGVCLGYELSKGLSYNDHATKTPLGTASTQLLKDRLVLATILRAGLPLQDGLRQVFDSAEPAFVGAGRKPETGKGVEIDLNYVAGPRLDGKILVLADTMLATGSSLVDAYKALVAQNGQPHKTFVIGVIASQPGLEYIEKHIPDVQIYVGAVDPVLNDKFFIVPGLGDAGDLLYGPKV